MTSSINPELTFTLDDAVEEVLDQLTGLGLAYDPAYDRYRTVARMINRALRANALEHEWSYYNAVTEIDPASTEGQTLVTTANTLRPRVKGDDAVRLVNSDDQIVTWAYFLPRDALHKYGYRPGLWCYHHRTELIFSRPLQAFEAGLSIQMPTMREPVMFTIPATPEDPNDPLVVFDPAVRALPVDFNYPDVIVARAAYMYSLTDPVMQPRAQTLEALYKDLMYQAIERDDNVTDVPYLNDFVVPVQNTIYGPPGAGLHPPFADEPRWV